MNGGSAHQKTTKDFCPPACPNSLSRAILPRPPGCALSTAQLVLNLLSGLGLTVRVGKQGRSYLYELLPTAFAEERILP